MDKAFEEMRLNKSKFLNDLCTNKMDNISISSSSSSSSSSTITSPQQPTTVRVSKFPPIQKFPPTQISQFSEFAPKQEAPKVDLNKTIRQPLKKSQTNHSNLLIANQQASDVKLSKVPHIYTSFNYQGLFRQENLLQTNSNFQASFQPAQSQPGRPIFKSK